jgi:hypothetical protein
VGGHAVPLPSGAPGILGAGPTGGGFGRVMAHLAAEMVVTAVRLNGISTGSALSTMRSDLETLFHHFWSTPRVVSPPARDYFGWWPGKIAGNSRSFAQVVATTPHTNLQNPMGDRGGGRQGHGGASRRVPVGGRFGGSGGGGGGGHEQNYVWQRDLQEGVCQNSSNGESNRWEPGP